MTVLQQSQPNFAWSLAAYGAEGALSAQTTGVMKRGSVGERNCRARGVVRRSERPRSRCLSFDGPNDFLGPAKRVRGEAESEANVAPHKRGLSETRVPDSGSRECSKRKSNGLRGRNALAPKSAMAIPATKLCPAGAAQ